MSNVISINRKLEHKIDQLLNSLPNEVVVRIVKNLAKRMNVENPMQQTPGV